MKRNNEQSDNMRIRVFFPFVVTSIILCLLDGGIIILFMLFGESEQFDLLFWLLISVFAIIPIILLISSIFAMGNVIEFDETGVRRIRFGRAIRNFSWKKVKTVSCTANDSWTG